MHYEYCILCVMVISNIQSEYLSFLSTLRFIINQSTSVSSIWSLYVVDKIRELATIKTVVVISGVFTFFSVHSRSTAGVIKLVPGGPVSCRV